MNLTIYVSVCFSWKIVFEYFFFYCARKTSRRQFQSVAIKQDKRVNLGYVKSSTERPVMLSLTCCRAANLILSREKRDD